MRKPAAARPDATTYVDFLDRRKAKEQADTKVAQLRESAARLDELDKRIKKGDLSPEDLAQARQDQQDIVASLPPEAREENARLQARKDEGKLAYRAADPAFMSAPALKWRVPASRDGTGGADEDEESG